MAILCPNKLTALTSIKSCMAWWRVVQHSGSCPWFWWYRQCSCRRNKREIRFGKGHGTKRTNKPTSWSFSKALVKVMPNEVNSFTSLWTYSLGGWGTMALKYGGCGCMSNEGLLNISWLILILWMRTLIIKSLWYELWACLLWW